jgi:hypothetical protein
VIRQPEWQDFFLAAVILGLVLIQAATNFWTAVVVAAVYLAVRITWRLVRASR